MKVSLENAYFACRLPGQGPAGHVVGIDALAVHHQALVQELGDEVEHHGQGQDQVFVPARGVQGVPRPRWTGGVNTR